MRRNWRFARQGGSGRMGAMRSRCQQDGGRWRVNKKRPNIRNFFRNLTRAYSRKLQIVCGIFVCCVFNWGCQTSRLQTLPNNEWILCPTNKSQALIGLKIKIWVEKDTLFNKTIWMERLYWPNMLGKSHVFNMGGYIADGIQSSKRLLIIQEYCKADSIGIYLSFSYTSRKHGGYVISESFSIPINKVFEGQAGRINYSSKWVAP